jgi:hypothetical protein
VEPELVIHEKLEVVLSRLEGVRRQRDGSFRSRCPLHGGKTTDDMKIAAGHKWIVFHCFAGCDRDQIRQKLELEWVDLVLDDSPPGERKPRRRDWRAIELESYACAARLQHESKVLERLRFGRGWAAKALELLDVGWDGSRLTLPVRDLSWKLHDVLRYDPFAKARKVLAGKGKSRLPWPSPERHTSDVCFLVEGEGTAISMTSVGLTAVALPGSVSKPTTSIARPGSWQGAGWHRKWAERFARFREVILLPDCDEQGRALMRAASYDLTKVGVSNHVIDIGPKTTNGSDIADHLLSKAYDGPSRKIARNVIREMVAEHAEVLVA